MIDVKIFNTLKVSILLVLFSNSSTIRLVPSAEDVSMCVPIATSEDKNNKWWMNSEIYTKEQQMINGQEWITHT